MSRGGFLRRYPVLGIRDFRLLLADRLIAPASVGFSIVGVSFAVLKATNSPAALSYVLAAQIAPSLVIVAQFGVVLMAWYGAFSVLARWWRVSTSAARPPGARSPRRMRSA